MGQDQDETRNLCLRVKGCFIGSKIMNRFGWSVVALLSLVIFLFTGLSLSLPWWAIDYSMNCGGYYKVLMLRNGMCTASSSQHPESNPNKCIAWYSEDSWAEVDATAGTDTEHDASYTYPLCLILEYTAIATALLQTLISFYQWKNIVKDLVLQRIVLLLSIICISLQLAISTIGAKTDVTDENTWKYTNDCSDSTSYPGLGYYFQGATFYMAWIVVFIANFPEKCWYETFSVFILSPSNVTAMMFSC